MNASSRTEASTGRAVIAGASLAGLFAARVLSESDHIETVRILDQDRLPDDPVPRRGVAQAHHSHLLHHAGIEVMEELFPGLTTELDSFGAGVIDASNDMNWFQSPYWKPQFASDIRIFWCERPRLEWAIRRRLQKDFDVEFLTGRKVVDYITSEDDTAITGVVADPEDTEGLEEWSADLVVDAMGRGTRTPKIFDEQNLGSPPIQRCKVDLSYTSCKVSHPDDYDGSWKTLAILPRIPNEKKMGVTYPVDDERFHVTLGGWCDAQAPADDDGFQAFAESLSHPAFGEFLNKTERISKLRRFRVPEAIWRRYDKMKDWPKGFLALGDAVCNFNPVYGQGMTVCAREAAELQSLLEDRSPIRDPQFSASFQRRITGIIRTPWLLATAQDQQFPQVSGDQQWVTHLSPLVGQIVDGSGSHEEVHRAFLEVLTMKSSPARFLYPDTALALAYDSCFSVFDQVLSRSSTPELSP